MALLIDKSFDDGVFQRVLDRLSADGHEVVVVGPKADEQVHGHEGRTHVNVDHGVDDPEVRHLDALLVPPGVPLHHLRTHERMLNYARALYAHGNPVAVARPDGWVLVRADAKSRGLISWPAVKRQLFIEGPAQAGDTESDVLISAQEADHEALLDAFCAQLEKGPRTGEAVETVPNDESAYPIGSPPTETEHPVD